jgi:hypothetical protein
MSQQWNTLLSSALLGTERGGTLQLLGESPLERSLTKLPAHDLERTLLGSAALISQHRRAGKILPELKTKPLSPAPLERRELIGEAEEWRLERLLSGEFREVLQEWLELCQHNQKRVPNRFLATLLEYGRNDTQKRELILKVIGNRGRWLAALNSSWKYAFPIETGEDDDLWLNASLGARLEALERTRASDPSKARTWLEETWKGETGEARDALIVLLQTGLSLEDEPFLERALDDRRKGVREPAAQMLSSLTGSAYQKRMLERLVPLLTWKKGRLEVELPKVFDKSMTRDGIEDKKVDSERGQRAIWLSEMLSRVPLPLWNMHFSATPLELIAGLQNDDFKMDVIWAWRGSLERFRQNLEWAEALRDFKHLGKHIFYLNTYLTFLTRAQQEELLLTKMADWDGTLDVLESPFIQISKLSRPWPDALTQTFLQMSFPHLLKVATPSGSNQRKSYEFWEIQAGLLKCAECANPKLCLDILKTWDTEMWLQPWKDAISLSIRTLEFRLEMHQEMKLEKKKESQS